MIELLQQPGVCFGFGGTNAREAQCEGGDIFGFNAVPTPQQPDEFFRWMARRLLESADGGARWAVAGFPGPVSADGTLIGPMENVAGMSTQRFHLINALTEADPAAGRLVEQGFTIVGANDGDLAAEAATVVVGGNRFKKTAALSIGTGVGAGLVVRDAAYENVHRVDRTAPTEIGHLMRSANPLDTYERFISGPALTARYGDPRQLDSKHPAWQEVATGTVQLATTLSLMHGAELVVPCGGVGAGAADKFMPYVENLMDLYSRVGNAPQRQFMPKIIPVPMHMAQTFEMYGAEPLMRDVLTRTA